MIFILSSISSGLEFRSANHTSINGNSESKVFQYITFFFWWGEVGGEVPNNWPNDLLGINVYKTLESCW